MFRCQRCDGLSQPGESSVRVIIETRDKTYPYREHTKKIGNGKGDRVKWVADPGGVGTEIVIEEIRHGRCI